MNSGHVSCGRAAASAASLQIRSSSCPGVLVLFLAVTRQSCQVERLVRLGMWRWYAAVTHLTAHPLRVMLIGCLSLLLPMWLLASLSCSCANNPSLAGSSPMHAAAGLPSMTAVTAAAPAFYVPATGLLFRCPAAAARCAPPGCFAHAADLGDASRQVLPLGELHCCRA